MDIMVTTITNTSLKNSNSLGCRSSSFRFINEELFSSLISSYK
ncbi:hypothetical protein PCIT_a1646 [Pseudoalteromonas citrea]|uniref:Uncharacterized protein n=1 Tax=Pseudoalteromonas citrea TaxID=43655 RepID=A0AAD4FTX3_9GAMM|nr:hypothetical protein PCIT_a1646 [Pseudoalteromonas citrea]